MANDIIDINVYETTETVAITVNPNLTTVNINEVVGVIPQNLQEVTNVGSTTTNSITANSFIKSGGSGTNILLDNGSIIALSSVGGNTNLTPSQTSTNFTINSDTGTDATIPLGDGTLAGATLNNYTTAEQTKLAGIATGAEVNVNADWNATSGDAQILNKPTIPSIAGLATTTYVDAQDALKQNNITLTTTGTNGASTLVGATLNIPQYSGATNLTTSQTSTNFTINSSTGDDAVVPLGNGTNAGATLNDYTSAEKTKLSGIASGAEVNVNADWNSVSGDSQILNKPTIPSIAGLATTTYVDTQDALKVDKVVGKGLSTEDYTTTEKNKLAGIAIGAEVNVNADWNATSGDAQILNKPTIPSITNLVPYTGATTDVNLGLNDITAEKLIKSGGTSSQILAADGSVITAGTNITITGGIISSVGGTGGGGSSVNYYLNGGTSQGTFPSTTYYEFSKTAVIGTGADFSRGTNGYIASFITDIADPSLLLIPAGNWNLEFYFSSSSAGGSPEFYVELYKYDGTTFTSIASNSATPEGITNGTSIDAYFTALAVPETVLTVNDRLAIRVFVNASSKTITLHTQNGHLCQVITTFTLGLTALNGLQAQVQNFATGTTGSDFAIVSSGSTHTFNLPSASATDRGVVTTGTQTFAGDKTFTGTTAGITKTMVGLSNVDNTTDLLKPISTATQTALNLKQPLATVLTNTTASFTTAEQTKLGKYPSTATNGKILQGNGTSYVEIDTPTGTTNLGYTASTTDGTVTSSTGDDATIPLANGTNAGLLTANEKTKLTGIATGATANSSDATLLSRTNHTGTQIATTISDIQSTITNNTSVVANTAKVSFDSTSSTRLANTSGTNTGDETTATIKTKLGITTLSGSNTGDETTATIKTKLSITTLSGSNTGDQDLSTLAPKASPTFTGTVVLPSTTSIGTVTSTEIGYLDNVTSAIQTQLDNKIAKQAVGTTYTTNAITTVSLSEYTAIGTKDPNTLYFII